MLEAVDIADLTHLAAPRRVRPSGFAALRLSRSARCTDRDHGGDRLITFKPMRAGTTGFICHASRRSLTPFGRPKGSTLCCLSRFARLMCTSRRSVRSAAASGCAATSALHASALMRCLRMDSLGTCVRRRLCAKCSCSRCWGERNSSMSS